MVSTYRSREIRYTILRLWTKWWRPLTQAGLAFAIAVFAVFFWQTSLGQRADLWFLSQAFSIRGKRPPPENVTIVSIDDESYQVLDQSTRQPFPRILVAKALEQIVAAKPKLIIIDAKIPHEKIDMEADNRLEAALRDGPTTLWSGAMPGAYTDAIVTDDGSYPFFPSEDRFRKAAKMELPMLLSTRFNMLAWMGSDPNANASTYERAPLLRPLQELGGFKLSAPGPEDLVNFYGDRGSVPRLPIYKLLTGDFENQREILKDKVVFLGHQSVGRGRGQIGKDEYMISASDEPMFGVEVHATIAANLIDQSWIRQMPAGTAVGFLYLGALLIGAVCIKLTPEKALFVLLLGNGFFTGITYYLFAKKLYWVPGWGTFLLISFFALLLSALFHYVIIKSFKKYVSKTFNIEFDREV